MFIFETYFIGALSKSNENKHVSNQISLPGTFECFSSYQPKELPFRINTILFNGSVIMILIVESPPLSTW